MYQVAIASDLGDIDYRTAHYVTRRYSELLASILSLKKLSPEALLSFDIDTLLTNLRTEIQSLLIRLSGNNSYS